MELLNGWNFFKFSSWTTGQTASFWTALGAIGTVGTLIYVLIDAHRNRNKINDLANIAKEISDQNDLIVIQNSLLIEQNNLQKRETKAKIQPDLHCSPATIGQPDNLIILKLRNDSHIAKITDIEFDESSITFTKPSVPFKLGKNERQDITGTSKNQINISVCPWNVKIHYTDLYDFPYILSCSGTGSNRTSHEVSG